MRIACDLDGVLYNWESAARYMLREYRGCQGLDNVSDSWDTIQEKVPPEDWKWLWNEGVNLGLFRYGHVVKGGIIGVRRLAEFGHKILVVTHRPASAVQDTVDWLSYVRLPFDEIHILTQQQPKSTIEADLLIDDRPENLEDWVEFGTHHAIQFVQPWNELTPRHPLIHRAYGWPHVCDIVHDFHKGVAA